MTCDNIVYGFRQGLAFLRVFAKYFLFTVGWITAVTIAVGWVMSPLWVSLWLTIEYTPIWNAGGDKNSRFGLVMMWLVCCPLMALAGAGIIMVCWDCCSWMKREVKDEVEAIPRPAVAPVEVVVVSK